MSLLIQSTKLIHCLAKRAKLVSSHHNRRVLFYKTKRYFSGDIESVVVPNLGDSITEGTVTAIHKQRGEKVATDDIVLEIETDKVSVDIRAPKDGYIANYFADIDQDVEVGALLYALSAEPVEGVDAAAIASQSQASATSTPSEKNATETTATSATPVTSTSTVASTATVTATSTSHRVPMIKFKYGLRDEIEKLIFGISRPTSNGGSTDEAVIEFDSDSKPFWELPAKFRPRAWKEEEIEAVNSGANFMVNAKSNYD